MRSILLTLSGVILLLTSVFGLAYFSYQMNSFFAPKYRALDAKVFKESEQYNDGMIRDLAELKRQYDQADDAGKAALRPVIRHRFEVYDTNKLPADLAAFYQSM